MPRKLTKMSFSVRTISACTSAPKGLCEAQRRRACAAGERVCVCCGVLAWPPAGCAAAVITCTRHRCRRLAAEQRQPCASRCSCMSHRCVDALDLHRAPSLEAGRHVLAAAREGANVLGVPGWQQRGGVQQALVGQATGAGTHTHPPVAAASGRCQLALKLLSGPAAPSHALPLTKSQPALGKRSSGGSGFGSSRSAGRRGARAPPRRCPPHRTQRSRTGRPLRECARGVAASGRRCRRSRGSRALNAPCLTGGLCCVCARCQPTLLRRWLAPLAAFQPPHSPNSDNRTAKRMM